MSEATDDSGSSLVRERHHANGVVARVSHMTYLGFSSYQAMAYRTDARGSLLDVKVEAGHQTLEDAQRSADALAHPNCDSGSCGVWGDRQSGPGQIPDLEAAPRGSDTTIDERKPKPGNGALTPEPST